MSLRIKWDIPLLHDAMSHAPFVQALCPHKEITRNQLMEYLINKQHIPLTLSLILTKRIYSPELEPEKQKNP